jgi:hypothetical protein
MIYALNLTERATDTCARRLARWACRTLTLKEIVGILRIQVVPATTDRPYKTLVTTGMSEYAMTAPTDASYRALPGAVAPPARYPLNSCRMPTNPLLNARRTHE